MLTLQDITYTIGKKTILDHFSFNFVAPKIYALTGANGSGKSSLAKIIAGIIRDHTGTLFLKKKDITSLDISTRAQLGISLSFQTPTTFKGVTAGQLIEIAAKKSLTKKEFCQLFSRVGLCTDQYLNRDLDKKLSGGELKRIEIASILARDTSVYIFDEPEAGIDLWSFNQLLNIFTQLKKEGRLVIIITHQERILTLADEILLLKEGKLTAHGNYQNLAALLPVNTINCQTCFNKL